MATRHFTRRRKQQVLENPTLVEKDEELQKQLKDVNTRYCRSISECSTCIQFYTEHATYKQYMNKKRKRKTSELEELKKEIESTAWIQCDNLTCRKWRRVPVIEVDQLADNDWFCTLNTDPNFNNCDVPEEDTEKYDQMAINCGLNYVKSEFWEGCLVWAKMPGYCSWPAVVTRSLETGDICERDGEDNPVLYHVEYLGKTHSRGWIKKTALKMFSQGRVEDEQNTVSKKGKKSNCSKTTFRKNETVKEAKNEAVILSQLTPFQRLDKCIYKYTYTYNDSLSDQKVNDKPKNNKISKTKSQKDCKKSGKEVKNDKINIMPNQVVRKVDQNICDDSISDGVVPTLPKDMVGNPSLGNHVEETGQDGEPQKEPNTARFEFNYDNSLVDKTKEERYCLDVEMYTKNEKAFEHDVLRFLLRNDIPYRGLPKLQNAPVTLFQIYLAVHERGGYPDVCKNRQWVAVCREVTNSQMVGGASVRVKAFYEKYLYPYELYIKGGDFSSYIISTAGKKPGPKKKPVVPTLEETSNEDGEVNQIETTVDVDKHTDNFDLLTECSVDLQEMLDNLEKEESICGLEDDITAAKNKLGIDITFFDETPPNKDEVKTPSEFDEAVLPMESAHEVPDIDIYSNPISDLESQEELLHEMQALQDGMELIDQVLEQL